MPVRSRRPPAAGSRVMRLCKHGTPEAKIVDFLKGLSMPTRRQLANAIRALSMDAVQKAVSGHPGMPMGMADIAQVLWCDHLKHNPGNPLWPDRDRFVLSKGHSGVALYTILAMRGYFPESELATFDTGNSRIVGSRYSHCTADSRNLWWSRSATALSIATSLSRGRTGCRCRNSVMNWR